VTPLPAKTGELFVVDGPPGTGKTWYLAQQAERAADKHGASSVAIASLTRTAASEIASRTPDIPDDNVATMHGHAYRALDRPELAEIPEALREWNAEHPVLQLTVGGGRELEDAPADAEQSARTQGDVLHAQVMNHRARLTPRTDWTEEQQQYAALWDDYKQRTGRLDFTDLIDRALQIPHPAAPAVLLLDEAQDFSRLELDLALHWAGQAGTSVVVGDTDQALYQWRGSDPEVLHQLPASGRRGLTRSRRVPQAVHDLAAAWVQQIPGRADVDYQPRLNDPDDQTSGTAQGSVRRLAYSLRYPQPIVDAVRQDVGEGRSVMLLTACGYQLAPVLRELRSAGVAFHNPHRVMQGAWNPMRGASRLAAFLRPDDRCWGPAARAWTWDDLRLWTDPLQASGTLMRGAKALIDEKCREDRFGESHADVEVPLETIVEILGDDGRLRHPALLGDVDWWQSKLRAKTRAAMTYPVDVARRQGAAALVARPLVTVGTIHSVKGGQADSVYVFPDLSKQGMWNGWHAGGPGRDQIVRMFYVALTRARDTVTILDPAGPEHVPMELLQPEHLAVAA
jgi:DNA helicase-2/ATP-dependent DNA helicase PcrA